MKEKSWSSCKYQQDLFRWELETVCPRGSIFLCQSQHGAYGSGEDGPLNYALGKAPEGCPRVVRAGIGTWRKRILADWCSSGTSFSSGPLPRTLPHNIYTFSSSSSLGSPIPITMFLKGRSSCQSRNSGPPASSRYPWPDSTEAQAVLPTTPCHVLSASPGFCSSQETWFRGSLAGQTVSVLSHPRHLSRSDSSFQGKHKWSPWGKIIHIPLRTGVHVDLSSGLRYSNLVLSPPDGLSPEVSLCQGHWWAPCWIHVFVLILFFLLSSFQLSWRKTFPWISSSLKSMITHSPGFPSISLAATLFSLCWLLFRRVLPRNVGMPQGWILRFAFILLRCPLLGSCCKYYLYTNDKCLFPTLTSLLSFGLLHPAFPLVIPVVHLSGISNEPRLCGP